MAKEGMVPIGKLREVEGRLNAREEHFLREKELWEERVPKVTNPGP